MPSLVIHAGYVLTPHEAIQDGVVVVKDGKIVSVGHRDEVQAPPDAEMCAAAGMTVAPGFVDIHVHGAAGKDVMEATPAALSAIATVLASKGTTSFVATTVAASAHDTCRSLAGISSYIRGDQMPESNARPKAEILGIHLEGPFISRARRGVHPEESLLQPSLEALQGFLAAAEGCARILTLAPELPGALEVIDSAVQAGLLVGIGHTDATYEEARAAIDRGARHAVHVYNAMRPFSHRDPGVLAAILTEPEVTAEIIADGVHVSNPAIQLLIAVKGHERVLAITDGTSATGMPDGRYHLGNFDFEVKSGVCHNSEGKLAGSTLTMDRALRNLIALCVPSLEALRMTTLYPARRMGLAGKKGVIAPGADADLVVLTPELHVAGVLTRGMGLA
jgi:N-acetylglucosamine-6-phosphate deacetylase